MLNSDLKLNPNIFDVSEECDHMRRGFGDGLLLIAEKNRNVVALCADLTESTQMLSFKQRYPERFVQVGVAEQNLVTVASGMAAMGKIPYVASYAVFSPGRNWEQIRTTICYNDQPVKIIGTHIGVNVGADGGSHQALEDIALMRVLPRMKIISPCDYHEARKAVQEMARIEGPVYMRLARHKTPNLTTEETPFMFGKANTVYDPRGKIDVGIIATGTMVYEALVCAKKLTSKGINARVLNIHTIKPLDTTALIRIAGDAGAIVTVEEHQIAGGLGSVVAECLAMHKPVPIEFVGVNDRFGQSGTPEELLSEYGLTSNHIERAVKKVLVRK